MSLLEIYKEKNKNNDWFNDHSSLAKGKAGRMFEYTNTNFRTQDTFTSDFIKFLEIENKARGAWPKQDNHGQEIHKHLVINMIQSKLFKKDANGIFTRTAKGLIYNDFINHENTEDEKWLINYLFLLNGYYFNKKNYIIQRVKTDLLGFLLSVDGLTEEALVKYAKDMLVAVDSLKNTLRSPFFYIHSFYNDSDFLINYLRSPETEREELAKYIESNLESKPYDKCCISKKYQPSGNFNRSMLTDETRVFLLTLLFIKSKDVNSTSVYEVFVDHFKNNISEIDKVQILAYLHTNKSIFDSIFADVLELEELDTTLSDVSAPEMVEVVPVIAVGDVPEDYIDETSEEGRLRIKTIFSLRKRQARIQGGFRCALEAINNCSPIYFTAKLTGKNYLELHHLIPREFRNDFSFSIEVLANYITLCPRCHRQIHLAVDRERKHLINKLFDERKSRLHVVGLKLDLANIYDYYKIDS